MKKYLKQIICLIMLMFISCGEKLPEPIAVTAVSLNAETVEMTEGDELILIATVSPKDADNKSLIWSSSNHSIASVVDGKVMANKPGKAIITVKTDDGGKTATCEVTVKEKVSDKDISIDDYPSAIVGLWETEAYLEDGILDDGSDGYRSVIQFRENDRYTFYDNNEFHAYGPDGEYYTSQKVSSFGSATYWVYQDKLFDKRESDWDCWEFGNPNCECNQTGGTHVTKIIKLTHEKLVLETQTKLLYDDDIVESVVRMELKRIEKLN